MIVTWTQVIEIKQFYQVVINQIQLNVNAEIFKKNPA